MKTLIIAFVILSSLAFAQTETGKENVPANTKNSGLHVTQPGSPEELSKVSPNNEKPKAQKPKVMPKTTGIDSLAPYNPAGNESQAQVIEVSEEIDSTSL